MIGTLQGTQLLSTVTGATPPLIVNSSALVTNLHADDSEHLGGQLPSFYLDTSITNQTKSGGLSLGSLTVSGGSTLSGPLHVVGTGTFDSSLAVAGNTTLSGNLSVGGTSSLTGAVAIAGAPVAGNKLTVNGNVDITGSTNISGDLAGGKFRGTCLVPALVTSFDCAYPAALAAAPAVVVVTPGGDVGSGNRYWVTIPGVGATTDFTINLSAALGAPVTFYYVVVE